MISTEDWKNMKDKQTILREWFNVPMYLDEPPTSETFARDARADRAEIEDHVPRYRVVGDEEPHHDLPRRRVVAKV